MMKQVVVYSGRFQPFHKGHYETYKHILEKFKGADVYIATSNKVESATSPFNFQEKKLIMTTMFNIPSNKIVEVKLPYKPIEILNQSRYNKDRDIFITVIGSHDKLRTENSKYFIEYSDSILVEKLTSFKNKGYVYYTPTVNELSGTQIREMIFNNSEYVARNNFLKIYSKFNESIFKMMYSKKKINEESILLKIVFDSDMKKLVAMTNENALQEIFGYYNREFFGKLKIHIINEVIDNSTENFETNRHKQINDFLKFACKHLKIKTPPKIELIDSSEYAKNSRALGSYDIYNQKISVCTKNRLSADILRTLAHELVHYKQHQLGQALNGETGSKTENSANIIAAILMRKFAEGHSQIFAEMSYQQLKSIDTKADQLMGMDVDLGRATDHFFIRLNDPRNEVEITPDELESFFERLSRKKDVFLKFLEKYKNELVVKDIKSKINIPFMKQSNRLIAKTIMRKKTFNTKGEDFLLHEMIKKIGDKWVVYPKKGGDRLGTHDTKQGAIKQLQAIELNKEDIEIDVDPGDTVLMGKFKNKKVIVKDIGVDDHGMPTINGKKATTFRIPTEPIEENDSELAALERERNRLFLKALKTFPKSKKQLELSKELDLVMDKIKKIRMKSMSESLLVEGGSYGRIHHPFDTDTNLTLGDLKQIIIDALNGDLELVREKTDGIAIAISYKNGNIIYARNKSHLINFGDNAMTKSDLIEKFKDRDEISDVFRFAAEDLERVLSLIPDDEKKIIFKEGKVFLNCEIIYPKTINLIPYDKSLIIFHNLIEYDENGNSIGEDLNSTEKLSDTIDNLDGSIQNNFIIHGPLFQSLPNNESLKNLIPIYTSKIYDLQKQFELEDSDKIKKFSSEIISKIEDVFLSLGADLLLYMDSMLDNDGDIKEKMLNLLKSKIDTIKSVNDPEIIDKLNLQLERLKRFGGIEKLSPIEGIVFNYKGNTYKLTGLFSPLNQINGILKYSDKK